MCENSLCVFTKLPRPCGWWLELLDVQEWDGGEELHLPEAGARWEGVQWAGGGGRWVVVGGGVHWPGWSCGHHGAYKRLDILSW